MSYSFAVKAPSRDGALKLANEELTNVCVTQPIHENDAGVASETVENLLDLATDLGEGEVYTVSVSGSLSWRAEGQFTSASLNVSVSVVKE